VGNRWVTLQVYESPSGVVRQLRFNLGLLQQLAGIVDSDGSMSIRKDAEKNTVSIFLGLASRDYRLLRHYQRVFQLGEVQVKPNSDLCFLEVRSRALVAAVTMLLQNQLLHPEHLRQQHVQLGKLGYSMTYQPPTLDGASGYTVGAMQGDGSWGIYRSVEGKTGRVVFKVKISLSQKALVLSETADCPESLDPDHCCQYDGVYYGHNPMVLQLQRAFPGSTVYLAHRSSRDSRGNPVTEVNSVWQVTSQKGLQEALGYFQRHPSHSAKLRFMLQQMPIFMALKEQKAGPEVLDYYYFQIYQPAKPQKAFPEYLEHLRREVCPTDALKRRLSDGLRQKKATLERMQLQLQNHLPAEEKPSKLSYNIRKLEFEIAGKEQELWEVSRHASEAHRKRRALEREMDQVQLSAQRGPVGSWCRSYPREAVVGVEWLPKFR
jgi:hypothetical protein